MKILYIYSVIENGDTSRSIQNKLKDPITYTHLSLCLQKLVQKKYLKRTRKNDRTYQYHHTQEKTDDFRATLHNLLQTLEQ